MGDKTHEKKGRDLLEQARDLLKLVERVGLAMLGFNGALALAFIGALAGTWDVPAARIGFGEGAIYLGMSAVCAVGTMITTSAIRTSPEGLFSRGRRIGKLEAYFCIALMIISMGLSAVGFALSSHHLRPCFVEKPPVACQPQDWNALSPTPQKERRSH